MTLWKKINNFLFPGDALERKIDSRPVGNDMWGEWQSIHGYRLSIEDGHKGSFQKIDYLSTHTKQGAKAEVYMVGDSLIVSSTMERRYFQIDKYPFLHQGKTCMILNGMLYTRIL